MLFRCGDETMSIYGDGDGDTYGNGHGDGCGETAIGDGAGAGEATNGVGNGCGCGVRGSVYGDDYVTSGSEAFNYILKGEVNE